MHLGNHAFGQQIHVPAPSWLLQFRSVNHNMMEKIFEKSIFFSSVVFFQSQAGNATVLEHRSPEPAASPLQKEPIQQIRYGCAFDQCICYVCFVLSGGNHFLWRSFPWELSSSFRVHFAYFPQVQGTFSITREICRVQAKHWNPKHVISLDFIFSVLRESEPPSFMNCVRQLQHMII